MRVASSLLVALLVLSGCTDSPTGGEDAGGGTTDEPAIAIDGEAAVEPPARSEPEGVDAGAVDAAQPEGVDAGAVDAALPEGVDAGAVDAAQPESVDAGAVDAAQPESVDAGAVDAALPEGVDDAGGPPATDAAGPAVIDAEAEADASTDASVQPTGGAVQWITQVRSPGDDGTMDVQVRRDGVVIVGVNRFLPRPADIAERPPYVVGLGADGRELFRFAFQLSGSSYFGYVPHVDPGDGSLRVYGYFDGTVQLGPDESAALSAEPGKESAFIASYDAQGRFLWVRTLSQPGGRPAVDAQRMTDSGDFVIAGSFAGNGALRIGSTSIPYASSRATGIARASHYVARVDRSGNVTKIAAFAGVCDSANGLSRVADVLPTAAREIVLVAGGFDCAYSADAYGPEEKTVQGQAAALVFGAGPSWDAAAVAYGFFYRGGAVRWPSGDWTALGQGNTNETWRFDAAGNFVYRRPGAPAGLLADGTLVTTAGFAGSVTVGAITLASSWPSTLYAGGYDGRGELLWARKLASYDALHLRRPNVVVDARGETTLTGTCPSAFADDSAAASGDYCITRLDATGSVVWHRTVGGVYDASALVTDQGAVWVQLEATFGGRWQRNANQFQEGSGSGKYVGRYGRDGTLELLLLSDPGSVFAQPLIATPDGGVLLARQLSSTPLTMFPGDPAAFELVPAPGDSGDGVLAKLRP